jgi:transketolase
MVSRDICADSSGGDEHQSYKLEVVGSSPTRRTKKEKEMKVCAKCKQEKSLECFSKNRAAKDGKVCYCRECRKDIQKKWREKNKEYFKEYSKKYREENKEKIKEKRKEYKEYLKEYHKKYYEENKDFYKEHNKKYYEKNKEYYKKYYEEYQNRHRERHSAGVYVIKNTQTGKEYIGCSIAIRDRWNNHRSSLRRSKHENPGIRRDYEKYGLEAFEFTLLKEYPCDTSREVLEQEETRIIQEKLEKGISLYNAHKT